MEKRMPVQIQCIDQRWWFVNEDGKHFVSVGVNHLQSDCWLAPYNTEFMLERYGDDLATDDLHFNPDGEALPRLVKATKARLQSIHLHRFGLHTYYFPPQLIAAHFYYLLAIEYSHTGSPFQFEEQ